MAKKVKNPRILIVTPEITYLPEGMGNLSGKMSAKAGGMADVSASHAGSLGRVPGQGTRSTGHGKDSMWHLRPRAAK